MITVKVARVGGRVFEVALLDGAKIEDALKAAGMTVSANEIIFLNHIDRMPTYPIKNNDVIILEKRKISQEMKTLLDILLHTSFYSVTGCVDSSGRVDCDRILSINSVAIGELVKAAKEVKQ